MDIVVNKCYGGFGLSEKAVRYYCELKGLKVYVERSDKLSLVTHYWLVPKEERVKEIDWDKSTLHEREEYTKTYATQHLNECDIKRDDKDLVATVRELGKEASGEYANLKIVKIPKDVKWIISEYDGFETVEEEHRSW